MYKIDTLEDAYLCADLFEKNDLLVFSSDQEYTYALLRPSSEFIFKRGDKVMLNRYKKPLGNGKGKTVFLDRDELAKELFDNRDRWVRSLNTPGDEENDEN